MKQSTYFGGHFDLEESLRLLLAEFVLQHLYFVRQFFVFQSHEHLLEELKCVAKWLWVTQIEAVN